MNNTGNARYDRTCSSVNWAEEEAQGDAGTKADLDEGWLDFIVRRALQALVGEAEPSARAWTEIRERIECSPQSDLAGEDKSPSSIESQDTR